MKANNGRSKAVSKKHEGAFRSSGRDTSTRWPMTVRMLATGALVAYTAVGVRVVNPAFAQAPAAQAQTTAPDARTYQFNIPAGPLDDVIDAFEATAGVEIELSRAGLSRIPSPGVQGSYSIDQALDRVLTGTGIVVRRRDSSTIVLDLAGVSQSVEVVGTATRLTSPKFTQPLLDTPQTVSVIPEQVFNEQGARNLTDVLRNTPGITFEAGENGFASATSNFSLRGIDTTGNIFVDGARDSGNYFRDIFNIEQVEVVKGPAADNGRGGAGGYINLATKTPTPESHYRLSFGYGFDTYNSGQRPRGAIDLNQRVGEGVSLRLNAFMEEGGVVTREVAERNGWGIAPSIAFGLEGSTRFTLGYQGVKQNDLPDWGVPGAMMPDMIGYIPAAGRSANRSKFYGHAGDYDDVTSHAIIGRFEHDFSSRVRLSNIARWSDADRQALYALPTGFTPATLSVATQRQAYTRENRSFSNLTNLELSFNTGAVSHTATTGFDISSENSDAGRYPANGILGNPGSTSLVNPDPRRPLPGFVGLTPTQTAKVDLSTVGAYFYDTMHLHRKWVATAGIRLERYGVTLASRTAAGEPQGPDGFDRDDTNVSGKAGLVFKPRENGSIYASFGVSVMPPASYLSTPDISREGDNAFPGWAAGPNSATSKVQRARIYEIGTKWNLHDNRLSATAAAFRTLRTNVAMAGTLDGVPNTFAGYGEQVVQGIELGATGSITRAWSIFGGILVMDSERKHDSRVDAARIGANPGDYGSVRTTNGDDLAFTPHLSANLWTSYRLPFGLTLGGGLRGMSDSYLGRPDNAERIIPNGNAGKLPGYAVLDLMGAYVVNRKFTLRFNMDNVTNSYYPISSNWAGSRIFLGPARSFRISTDINF